LKINCVAFLALFAAAATAQPVENSRTLSISGLENERLSFRGSLTLVGKGAHFTATAVNESNHEIQSVRLCVVADTPRNTPCLFTLWNTDPWKPGAELSWDLSSTLELPDLWFDVKPLSKSSAQVAISQPAVLISSAAPKPARAVELGSIRRIFIDRMPNDLDQYLRAEITKQMSGEVIVVLKEADADAILTGVSEEQKGAAAQVTGRYLGLHDTTTGSVSLVDRERTEVLWASEAGDRSLWKGPLLARDGPRKVADRLIHNLRKALGH
jgi:hypothetical protein